MSGRIIDYDIVAASDMGSRNQGGITSGTDELARRIREKIQEGWQPFGAVQRYDSDPHIIGYTYIQVLVKYADA